MAVSVRTEPRFTRDIDIAVAVDDDDEAEAVVRAFAPRWQVVASVEHETLGRLASARLCAAGGEGPVLGLLFASSGIEDEVVSHAELLEVFPDLVVPVARVGHLLALKLLSVADTRPQDTVDLAALQAAADEGERTLAKAALARIMERGTNRGRDLLGDARRL